MVVNGMNLAMRRGDTEELSVGLSGYELKNGDFIEMTIRRAVNGPVILHKRVSNFSNNEALIVIEPTDTQGLQPGDYIYDIQLTFGGRVKTIVPENADQDNPTFHIGGDVTYV